MNVSKLVKNCVIAAGTVALLGPTMALAQDTVAVAAGATMGKGLAALGAGLAVVGGGVGIGLCAKAAVESIARQPEMAQKIQLNMILAAALIEGATLFGVVVGFLA